MVDLRDTSDDEGERREIINKDGTTISFISVGVGRIFFSKSRLSLFLEATTHEGAKSNKGGG